MSTDKMDGFKSTADKGSMRMQIGGRLNNLWRRILRDSTSVVALGLIALLSGALVDTTARAAVNRSSRVVHAPTPLQFSSSPTNEEFLQTRLFAEPLAPVAATTPEENRDLARAIERYQAAINHTQAIDAVEPLNDFIAVHPASPWKPALQLNLGLIYRRTGHFSKALEIWQAGWMDAQALSDPQGRALANAIVARLSQLEAYLGRKEQLQPLLDTIHDRSVGGTASQLLTDSRNGLYDMVYHPEDSFRCGPLALTKILNYHNHAPSPIAMRVLRDAHSTDHGLSLAAVQKIASEAQMHYQAAFRAPGAEVILPAVAHWKVGHYAAIVDRAEGRYVVQDTTFGEDIRVSPKTLDEEASGYFLIPNGPLPKGWRPVTAAEGEKVWGRGDTGQNHDTGDTGCCANPSPGMTTASVEYQVVGLRLSDRPVGYTPPVGPAVQFDMYYSHRDTQQPATFAYTNFGPKWTFTWLSYITDSVNSSASAVLYQRGGGNETYTFSSTSATTAYPGPFSQSTLVRSVNASGNTTGFTLTHPDGSIEQYDLGSGNQFFMTAVSDPAGNFVTLTYDSQMRIVSITDAVGEVSTLSYGLGASSNTVTKITDPFGRSASFNYTSASGALLLTSITDTLGITSSYAYGQGTDPDFINALTTPYGTTSFVYGDISTNSSLGSTRFLKMTDPLGRTSYTEFDQGQSPGDAQGNNLINPNLVPAGMYAQNGYFMWRNTFIFDANQYALATQNGSLNYALGKNIHWCHSSDEVSTSRFIESQKEPLENRVWYNYPGQGQSNFGAIFAPVSSSGVSSIGASNRPSAIGRVLDNGKTQLQTFQYNAQGNVTQATDPAGRIYTLTYAANGIDLLTTSNTTSGSQLLETRTYNTEHLPLTIMGANGKTAHYVYNAAGQLTKYTNQLGYATTLAYDGTARLKTIKGAVAGAQYSLAYDTFNRIASLTDPAGSIIRYTYDAADRPLTAKYPDTTTQQFGYTYLDLTSFTDRLGQKTVYYVDADREFYKRTDALNHSVELSYNPAGQVNSITDENGHTTTFVLDAQSRVSAKQYINGTSETVTYQSSISRVATVTDALGQSTNYTYNLDNTVATIGYIANQTTPDVSFTYDPVYRRVASMTDGTGATNLTYAPVSSHPSVGANQLQSITSPVAGTANTDTVVYSYDALNRVVGMAVNGLAQSRGFDALGRLTSVSNPLDTFTYAYADATSRVSGITSNAGPNVSMTYFSPTGDELLQQVNYATHSGSTSLAQFGYTYNADDNVKSGSTTAPSTQTTTFSYDKANRLVSGLISGTTPQYQYVYDAASNLTSITPNGATQNYSLTSVNTIHGGSYDANGSTTALGSGAYTWDGANRVISFANSSAATSSSFTYDGLGRLVRVVDSHSGSVTADHSYFWCGVMRCLAHDNTQSGSPVSTQYFDQGAIIAGVSYYYTKDELGSVTQLISTTGAIATQYAYDPYGNRTTVSGTVAADIGYAGYFAHAQSGLAFTLFRAYDPAHARWLNRDPIGENGGINLYAYVGENPLSETDPIGFCGSAHSYSISIYTTCSAASVFAAMMQPGMTAPGAPAAQEWLTWNVPLTLGNEITQLVVTQGMTIINITQPGHRYYPGAVTIKVTPGVNNVGSVISVDGEGTGRYAIENDAVGYAFFGNTAWQAAFSCFGSNAYEPFR